MSRCPSCGHSLLWRSHTYIYTCSFQVHCLLQFFGWLLPRDALHKRISANCVVTRCPSVCHTTVLSKFFSQSGSHTIIFFIPHVIATFRRGPPRRMQGVWNNRDFAISRFISQMIQDRAIVTMQCEYETVYIYPSFVTVPFSMTLGDLGWLSEIFNNIKTAIRSWPVSGSTFASYQYHRFCETTNDEC